MASVVRLASFAVLAVRVDVLLLLYQVVVRFRVLVRELTSIVTDNFKGVDEETAVTRRIGYYEGWAVTR